VAVDATTLAVGTATLGLREADAKVAGADGADDRVAIARRLHLDPRAAEVGGRCASSVAILTSGISSVS